LRSESGCDLAEAIRDAYECVYLGKSEVRIDLSRHYELETELEDAIFILRQALAAVRPILLRAFRYARWEREEHTCPLAAAALGDAGRLGLHDRRPGSSGVEGIGIGSAGSSSSSLSSSTERLWFAVCE
jgi:hypothetical protein